MVDAVAGKIEEKNDEKPITNEDLRIELLADKYSRAILSLTSGKECSALQLSQELNIPKATVYRKLKLLEDSGMIQHVKTIINLSGNEEKFYRSSIREASLNFRDGVLSVSIKKADYSDKVVRLWQRLAHPNGKTDSGHSVEKEQVEAKGYCNLMFSNPGEKIKLKTTFEH